MLPESSEQRVPLVCPDEGGRSPISFAYNGAHATWNTRSMSGLRLGPSAIRPLRALGIEISWPSPSKVTFALEGRAHFALETCQDVQGGESEYKC